MLEYLLVGPNGIEPFPQAFQTRVRTSYTKVPLSWQGHRESNSACPGQNRMRSQIAIPHQILAGPYGVEPYLEVLETSVHPHVEPIYFQLIFAVRAILVEGSAAVVTHFYQRSQLKIDPSADRSVFQWIKIISIPFSHVVCLKSTRQSHSGPALFVDRES